MVINHNIAALRAAMDLSQTSSEMGKSVEKIVTGLRIVDAGDDPGAVGILGRLYMQVSGVDQALRNTQSADSLTQTAYDALSGIADIIARVKTLAQESANGTYTDSERASMQQEVSQLVGNNAAGIAGELDGIASGTKYNSIALLDGTFNQTFLIGTAQTDTATLSIANMGSTALGQNWFIGNGLAGEHVDVSTQANAQAWLNAANGNGVDDVFTVAINQVATEQGKISAISSRLGNNENYLSLYSQNIYSALSTVGGVDYAAELANFSRLKFKLQAGTAILAQANLLPDSVLKLLE
jgi:flagellin